MINSLKSAPKIRFPVPNPAESDFIWALSGRACGNMSLFYGDTRYSLNNREGFLKKLGVDYRDLVCAKQAHGSRISYADEGYIGKGALDYEDSITDTDAFITDKKNIPLAIFTADCLSIFIYDSQKPAIGLVHAGWRGTKENLAAKTIQLMQEEFNSRPSLLRISFGPAIRSCCYEVKEEFADFFGSAVTKRGRRYYMDLAQANISQILDCGAKEENIFDPKICTSCANEEFFSYRREGNSCGRMMTIAMLK